MNELTPKDVDALPSNIQALGIALLNAMAPAGMLGLPRLLDERRIQYGIPNGAFDQEAMYDRLLVFQVPDRQQSTFEKGGLIEMPDSVKMANLYRAPVGIVVSGGLRALDSFVSNGGQLGDKVTFVKNAPFYVRCDTIGGKDFNLVVLTDGELVGNFDLAKRLKERRLFKVQNPTEGGRVEHVFKDDTGKILMPQAAWREES